MSSNETQRSDDERPYFSIVGELVADFIAFGKLVELMRPEIAAIPGPFVMTVDAAAGIVVLGKRLSDETVVVVEQVRCDPHAAASFGASIMTFVVDGSAPSH